MKKTLLPLLGVVFSCGNLKADLLYANALPNILINQQAGALRTNIAFTESDPLNYFDGTQVKFSADDVGANGVRVTSISTYSVASVIDDPLGLEFTNVKLYFRPLGGTWQVLEMGSPNTFFDAADPKLVKYDNPDITSTEVSYNYFRNPYYQSTNSATPDLYYPLWENTFTGLDLILSTGLTYEFAVWGTNPNPDSTTLYGYWFNHYSNPFLGLARADNKSGNYLRCDALNLSAPCFIEDPRLDQTFDKGANLNILISGTPTQVPEPSSIFLSSAVLLFFLLRSASAKRLLASLPR